MNRVATTMFEGEVFNHRLLWRCARLMKDQADAQGKGSVYYRIAAMLMARLTVEAYANFLLDVLAPEVLAEERQRFGSSIDRKLTFIYERCGLVLDRGHRPYQTMPMLDRFRDGVVHARPEVYRGTYEHPAQEDAAPMRPGELPQAVEKANCDRALEDVSAIANALHAAAHGVANEDQQQRLEPRALEGTLQFQTISTTLADAAASTGPSGAPASHPADARAGRTSLRQPRAAPAVRGARGPSGRGPRKR
jgi:hypothetical protein